MTQTHFLAPQKIKIKRRDGQLILKMDGQCLPIAPPRRSLPLSAPNEFIVLSDQNGNELGIVRRVEDLEPCSRAVMEEELDRIYNTIIIERVLEIKRDPLSNEIMWRVEIETDEEESTLVPLLKPKLGVRLLSKARSTPEGEETGEVTSGREVIFHIAGTEDVQNARYPRIFIGDTQGKRYEIPNCEELDLNSRRLGERYF